jgi:7-cyano-7-deazaguanine synthase
MSFQKTIDARGWSLMISRPAKSTIGVLLSGGLDSAILLGHLVRRGHAVRPFYVRSRLVWEAEEYRAVLAYLRAISAMFPRRLQDLVVLDLPTADLYQDHWSVTGCEPPEANSPAEAVYLPGRNALLLIKSAMWCQLHGIQRLALGILGTNPFADATPAFFHLFGAALNQALGTRLKIIRPLARMDKRQVMELGRGLPLELTFSCVAPVVGLHCGQCNKCAERQEAFRLIDARDPTPYAVAATAGI